MILLQKYINKKYDHPTCVFIDNKNQYKDHIIAIENKNIKIEIIN